MVLRDRTRLEKSIEQVLGIEQELDDAATLIELGEAEDDAEVVAEAEATIAGLQRRSEKLELESLLSGEVDGNDCYIEINAGAGGTESQDWAEMLARMYLRWAESHDHRRLNGSRRARAKRPGSNPRRSRLSAPMLMAG